MDQNNNYTKEEMIACFKAGVDFGRDMFNNPSNSEYINRLDEKRINQKTDNNE